MKRIVSAGVAACLLLAPSLPAQSQSNQVLQGMQLRLVLLNGLSTSVARDGDPFTAVVAEPVYLGGQLLLPAGVRVHGQVGSVLRPKRFALFRGQAALNLTFRSVEVDRREIPARMSVLAIQDDPTRSFGRKRKDLRIEEGEVVKAKPDVKGDVITVGLGAGGGTVAGAVFGHLVRGLTIGLVGGTAYIMAKRGKEVELPAQTVLLVRLDSNLTLPEIAAGTAPYSYGSR